MFGLTAPLRIGFTGTEAGLTMRQRRALQSVLSGFRGLGSMYLHHGDCIGADEQAHYMARSLGYLIVGHPPDNDYKRARCVFDETMPEKPYLERNHDIVGVCMTMIACPRQVTEQWRGSGTWATIRYAVKRKVPLIVIYPDATIEVKQ